MAALEKIQAKTFWPIHIEHWQASGLSQVAYCRQHDLCPQKLGYWKRKSTVKPTTSPTGFTRIRVDGDRSSAPVPGLSLQFNDGIRLEGITQDTMPCIQPLLELLR
ncbi:IS66 family insertion sequence element accessory protein TnpA [Methyloprofundus sp.]|uniref:IS66 family insertion sequence element accessory protein TnpA n=1 Tax=Methyloprofundus sp. TaxID=2020875 RepID=UPI003D13261E